MKFNPLFLLLPLLSFGQISGDYQKMPEIIPPSPTVSSLMQFEEVPIDYHTGQPDISIPLLTKQIDKELTMPLVLKYSTLGVRIQSKSGWMGTGWALDAGGVISRTVIGVPDEKQYENKFKTRGIYYNDAENFYNKTIEEQNEYGWNVLGTSDGSYDSDYDLYQFSMLGITGRFIVDGNHAVKILSEDQNIKIAPEFIVVNNTPLLVQFIITDTNGYEYVFNVKEENVSQTLSSTTPRFSQDVVPVLSDWSEPVISAWHLLKIRKNGIDLVTFEYANYEERIKTFSTTEYRISPDFITSLSLNNAIQNTYNQSQLRPKYTSVESEVVTQTKKISKINFLHDGTAVKFEMQGSSLKNIKYVQETGIEENPIIDILKDIDFNQSGSIDRSWLNEITINDSLEYKLNYYDKESLPGYSQYGGDNWGFCKADYRDDLSHGYDYYDSQAYKRGLLTSIEYPTGGKKEFEWEPHSFSFEGANQITDYNVYDNNPHNSQLANFEHSFNINIHTSDLDSGETIVFTHDQFVAVALVLDPLSGINSSNPDFNKFEVCFGNNCVSLNELPKSVGVLKGTNTCKVRVKPGQAIANNASLIGKIKISYKKIPIGAAYDYTVLGGGARIRTIKFTDPNSSKPFEKMLGYDYSMDATMPIRNSLPPQTQTVKISSGGVDSRLGSALKEYNLYEDKYLFAQAGSYKDVLGVWQVVYKVITGQSNVQMSKGGNYVSYTKVKEYELTQIPGTAIGSGVIVPLNHNGYTEYSYTGVPDFPSPAETFTYPYKPQPNLDYKRGSLKSKIVYNSNNQKLIEVNNSYEYPDTIVASYPFIWERTDCAWKQFYDKWEDYANTYPNPGIQCMASVESPTMIQCFCSGDLPECLQNCGLNAAVNIAKINMKAGRAELVESNKTEYFYKDGIVSSTETKTTYDYNEQNYQLKEQVDYLKEKNTINAYKTRYEYPLGGYDTTLFKQEEIVANDSLVQANIINKPLVISSYKNNALLQRVVNKYKYNPNWGLTPQIKEVEVQKENYPLEDRILYHKYDEKGNPLKVSTPGGIFVYYIWGYGETLPVAKIETADENFNTDSIIEGLSESIHTYSFHVTYNEQDLIGELNALRNQLPDAMVTTLIHEPGVGVKTITDPRGITLTYEYDEQGRLKSVRDNQGNLVSEHLYRYRTQED